MVTRKKGRPRKKPRNEQESVPDEVRNDKPEEAFPDAEVARQSAAVKAIRDAEIDRLVTMIRLLGSEFSEEQCQVPVLQFFKENMPELCIVETGTDGYEVRRKEKDGNFSSYADDNTLHASLLHRLSSAYPDYFAGNTDGFTFSNKSVKTAAFGADKLQIRSLVLEEPSDSQTVLLTEGLQTPDVNNSRLSVGMTPKTRRVPKHGEVLLSVHGSPLGVYKEDNMETIEETEDMVE